MEAPPSKAKGTVHPEDGQEGERMRASRIFKTPSFWILLVLFFFSLYLALNRIYQVDEAQNLYMARVAATGKADRFFTNASLFLLGPLSWLSGNARHSVEVFHKARLLFLGLMWLNFVLLAQNTGEALRPQRWGWVLVAAGTLAPLWDYGFEIRHDNVLLAGILLILLLARPRFPRAGGVRFFLVGAVTCLLTFTAFKAALYTVPLSIAILAFPHPAFRAARKVQVLAWLAGVASAALLVRGIYGGSGLWQVFIQGSRGGVQVSAEVARFGPGMALGRLLTQTPLLLGLAAGALFLAWMRFRRLGRGYFAWDTGFPELAAFLVSLGVLLANPTPFPYNLVLLVPFIFLLATQAVEALEESLRTGPALRALALGTVLFAHGAPFILATWRHVDMSNDRQEQLMSTAELMTDPARDRVYDGIGMVVTRDSIDYHWFLHSLNLANFRDGRWETVAEMLQRRPPSVIITSYRMTWLRPEDFAFIQAHYLRLANDFWVLGATLPEGGGPWKCDHPGRYQLLAYRKDERGAPTSVNVDGRPFGPGPGELPLGEHRVDLPAGYQGAMLWVGPTLSSVPELEPGDPLRLFQNWY